MFIVVEPLVWLFLEILMIPVKIALWIAKWLFAGVLLALSKIVPFTLKLLERVVKYLFNQSVKLVTYCWNRLKEYRKRKMEERLYVYPYEHKILNEHDADISKW